MARVDRTPQAGGNAVLCLQNKQPPLLQIRNALTTAVPVRCEQRSGRRKQVESTERTSVLLLEVPDLPRCCGDGRRLLQGWRLRRRQ